MIQPRRTEVGTKAGRETFVFAEDDAGDERASFSFDPQRHRVRERPPQRIRDAGKSTAPSDDPKSGCTEDDVSPLPLEVFGLVERAPLVPRPWRDNLHDDVDDRSLRRGALWRKVEARTLVDVKAAEAAYTHRDSNRELAPPRRSRDLRSHECRLPDVVRENACVQDLEPHAPPPPAGRTERDGERECAPLPDAGRDERDGARGGRENRCRDPKGKPAAQADTEGGGGEVRSWNPVAAPHRSTRGFNCSSRDGPMPGTASSSSTDENAPFAAR